ncbi:hypothetical protein KAU45_09865 [bacterium]|nr:hypothetical protein [bacterium]
MYRIVGVIILVVAVLVGILFANIAEPPGPVIGWDQVEPILVESCTRCHDGDLALGGVDLSSYEAVLSGDDPAAVPYDLGSSLVRILSEQPRSGMRGPDHTALFSEEEKNLVFRWIEWGCYLTGWDGSD